MADAGFVDVVSEAKRLEKKLVEYAPYQDDIHIARTMDMEPRDYMDLTYPDMVNLYERNHKIISTAGLGILTTKAQAAAPAAAPVKTGEVETRLREMTTETLQKAEEVAKEPIVVEREAPPVQAEEEHKETQIEFEERPATRAPVEEKIEIEREEKPAPEIEEEKPKAEPEKEEAREKAPPQLERPPERPLPKVLEKEEGPKVEVPMQRKVIVATVPPALKESPDAAAARRYTQMKEQIVATLGESADAATIKKKMLELTKQLFKEKITSKREEIKLQITALKNMLAGAQTGGRTAAGAKKKEATTNARLFQSMLESQQTELAHTKDSIIDSYNKQVSEIRKKFYDDIATTEDPVQRKKIFEGFAFSITTLVEQLPEVVTKYKDFTTKKHTAEMEKLSDSLVESEKDIRKAVEDRMAFIKKGYGDEFTSVRDMIARDIGNLIDKAGTEVLKTAEEEKPTPGEAKAEELVTEINETEEGTLLYYLHTNDPEYYKRYEKKQLAKAEALLRAKQLIAKEKGLSDGMVKKFFGRMEG
ncbi:MAG: hypothetical protein PHF60_01430 [Candidatus ainarchaeum sp.]|nr:hypothetical protein [Candidatus ainarchaeum sp.]